MLFFTVALLDQRRLLTDHIANLRQICVQGRRRKPPKLAVIVVRTDYLYCD